MAKLFRISFVFLLAAAVRVQAFSLLGPGGAEGNPAKLWQLRGANSGWDIGYARQYDIGGPMDLIEFYRWNVPVITYAYEASFIDFFGTNGMRAVDEAIQVLNDLPPASKMSETLEEFPLSTVRPNYEAVQLGLYDLKSTALSLVVEELGLAAPERWVWSIRRRTPVPNTTFGVYEIIQYNFDPVTLDRSPYVNGTLYTYTISENPPPGPLTPWSEALEVQIPSDTFPNLSVASGAQLPGYFFSGLTRDDVGALRYLLHPKTLAAETLLTNVVTLGGAAWQPVVGTNFLGTNGLGGTNNNLITAGVRGGVNKIRFKKVFFDDLVGGTFTPVTNRYVDRVHATNRVYSQAIQRGILRPDIVFTVEDLGPDVIARRTTTDNWINNDQLTPEAVLGGPGVITPPITITFNMILPIFLNETPFFVSEPAANDPLNALSRGFIWSSFDGTTNPPVIYPQYRHYSIGDVRRAAQSGGGL